MSSSTPDPAPRKSTPRATVLDVAHAAGVSVEAVLRVLNGQSDNDSTTLGIVSRAIADLGFVVTADTPGIIFDAVGIDLGTTRSAVSFVDQTGRTEMLRNADDEVFTPSVVFFEDDTRIVGREAVRRAAESPNQVVVEAKRDIGMDYLAEPICGQQVPPEAVQACILRTLRNDIKKQVGDNYAAVVTVPAYFDESRRTATIDSAKIAELNILDIVNEPTAAALAFGERLGYLTEKGQAKTNLHLMVYDLGGGTFDVTIVHLQPQKITTLATGGDMRLGGHDWDQRMVELIIRKLRIESEWSPNSPLGVEVRRRAVEAKHTLSTRQEVTVEFRIGETIHRCAITRDEFEDFTEDLLDRTSFTMRQVLSEANLKWSDLGRVLLVGGCTRMPMIHRLIETISGKPPDTVVNPDEAVARGAAIFAQHLLCKRGDSTAIDELTITDVNSHSLGIEGINMQTGRKENTHIIHRNTPLPHVVSRQFVTKMDDQQSVVIQVLEGESQTLDGCVPLGRAVIRNLPSGLKKGHPINVDYVYNTNGRLEVRGYIAGIGTDAVIELKRTKELSSQRLAAWRQIVCKSGGFSDFEAVLEATMSTPPATDDESIALTEEATVPEATVIDPTTAAAVDHGAPPEAARTLQDTMAPKQETTWEPSSATPIQRKKKSTGVGGVGIQVLGHVLFSGLGLIIGYYLLVFIRPDANFLNLSLPGMPAPVEVEQPLDPTAK